MMTKENISNKIKLDYGTDEEGKSKGSWTFSKVLPGKTPEQYYDLAQGLNSLQVQNDAKFYRISEYKIAR